MDNLSELVEHYGTDKNKSGYTHTYSSLFYPIKDKVTSVLEIGLGTLDPTIPSSFIGNINLYEHYKQGGSLRVWRDYFHNAEIYGGDIAEDCMFTEERIKTFLFDSSDPIGCQNNLSGLTFDIIIDDGNHDPKYQVQTLKNLFPLLKKDGYYIIEDLGGYPGTEELLIEYKDKFEFLTEGYVVENKGNHIVIKKTHISDIKNDVSFELNPPSSTNLTVVTGLWDIGRPERDFDHYLANFSKFLEIPINMFIYVPAELEHLVWEKRSRSNTHVRIFELSDVKDLYSPFWDKTQELRTSDKWLNQTGEFGWLKNSPQALNEWYNPIVQSKMFMLNDAKLINKFDDDYLIWLDAGITNTVYEKYFTENKCLDKLIPYLKTFLFLSYPYISAGEIHGFDFAAMNKYAHEEVKYVCRGGLFGGHRDFISQANSTYYHMLHNSIHEGYMGTEESIFSIMAHIEPHIYRRYALADNGLIVKFVQALLDDEVELENNGNRSHVLPKGTYNGHTDKTTLYMLTFNFPEQIEHTLKTWEENSSDWLSKPRKVLIDNSTNEEARINNKVLADKWGFEHIIREGNTGINGGRLFAAEHFDESDSDYYFFFEDDMGFNPSSDTGFCRNGFRNYVPNLYKQVHEIMAKEEFDFMKLSFTEVYMDNHLQVSWYNIPQALRTHLWPDYDQLPITGLDPYTPRTTFDKIDNHNGLSYISGEIYYANWPMVVNRAGNKKMFLDTKWAHPYEQTWMSHMFQETLKGNLKPAVLLASPVWHNRIAYYKPEERREN
jgi:hypothetical protein